MPTNGVQIQTEVLTQTAKNIRDLNKAMDEKLQEINKQMDNLSGSWIGEASDDARAAMNALKPRFEDFKTIVCSYADFLDNTVSSYVSTEVTIKKNASSNKLKFK